MKKDIAVSIKNVSKKFHLPGDNYGSLKMKLITPKKDRKKDSNDYHAIKDVSLDIKKGEFIGILGRNGAGKSSLLKMMAGIYQPTGGQITVNGRLVPFIELGVGFNKNLTGKDNVYLNGAMLGFTREEIDKMYDSIVDFAELHKFMNQKLRNYSSGMKVRLAFSIAIKADADILLLDEVLAVGDAAFKRKCHDHFNQLKEDKKTIIFVTHNMGAVNEYCDRAVLLDEGRIAYDGSPEGAAERYYELFNAAKDKNAGIHGEHVSIENIVVEPSERDLITTVKMINKSDRLYSDVLLRVAIKRQNGRVVAGFDNKNTDQPFEIDLKPKESKTLVFRSPNLISAGTYIVNASLSNSDGSGYADEDDDDSTQETKTYDSRLGIAQFTVSKSTAATPVVLPTSLEHDSELNTTSESDD